MSRAVAPGVQSAAFACTSASPCCQRTTRRRIRRTATAKPALARINPAIRTITAALDGGVQGYFRPGTPIDYNFHDFYRKQTICSSSLLIGSSAFRVLRVTSSQRCCEYSFAGQDTVLFL